MSKALYQDQQEKKKNVRELLEILLEAYNPSMLFAKLLELQEELLNE